MPVMVSPDANAGEGNASDSESKTFTQANVGSPSSRRIVKAKPPPPIDLTDPVSPQDEDDDTPLRTSTGIAPVLKSPSLNREQEQETSEKWRQERRDANAAIQRSQRDKEVQQRRQHAPPTSETIVEMNALQMEVPPVLSVEPQFPEHKRSGATAALPEDGKPSEKRRKASIDDEMPSGAKESNFSIRATRTAVAVAVLAIAFAFAFKRARV